MKLRQARKLFWSLAGMRERPGRWATVKETLARAGRRGASWRETGAGFLVGVQGFTPRSAALAVGKRRAFGVNLRRAGGGLVNSLISHRGPAIRKERGC